MEPKSHHEKLPDMNTLRNMIPKHCFEPSLIRSCSYVVRDLAQTACLFYLATRIPEVQNLYARIIVWSIYGFVQSLCFVGLWILAHECGHHSFSLYKRVNSCIGFVLHSLVMVPFFSWKYTHSRHHRYTNNMDKDTVFVPPREQDFRSSFFTGDFLGHAEDAPLVSLALLISHQLLGWPMYMLFNASAGAKSLARADSTASTWQCHYNPAAHVFTASEIFYVFLSDVGLLSTAAALWKATEYFGVFNVALMYGLPYLWMNHWLIAITYLHHTHPDVDHYEDSSWTFQKGALSTVDRDFGFIGRHLFHGIIEYHVIHHMFAKIPFYHAEEATRAIAPALGKQYIESTKTSFLTDLWTTFTDCAFVVEDSEAKGHMKWGKPASIAVVGA